MTALALPRLSGMPWVTWRQHRVAFAGVVALLGGVSVFFLLNGLAMHRDWTNLGLSHCTAGNGAGCPEAASEIFYKKYQSLAMYLPRFLEFVPGLLGVFVGAPLVARELETGTFRFAWTQGTHRVRWLVVKLALLGAALTVLALGFSAVFDWWFGPWQGLMGRMESGQAFEIIGTVFAARTLFGFVLGVLLGALIRRTVAAMAATAAAWAAVIVPAVIYLRPLIQAPIKAPEDSNPITRNGWVVDSWVQDAAGHHASATDLLAKARAAGVTDFRSWFTAHGYRNWVAYQPDGRFWHFQVVETCGYAVLALLLGAAAVWWVRHRAA